VNPPSGGRGWIVIREGRHRRWGGELRRRHVFAALAAATSATIVEKAWSPRLLRQAARGPILGRLPGPLIYRLPQPAVRPRLAASEKLRDRLLDTALAVTDPAVVAIYDDPVAQSRALGVDMDAGWLAELAARQRRNVDAFRWHVVPTASFAELIGLDPSRVIVGGNGTDTARIEVGPWPAVPAIGIVSGAAPGRGLELLVAAARLARERVAELRLLMWLVPTSDAGETYLAGLRASVAGEPWVSIETAGYEELGSALAQATALCVPHPPNEYMDVALPVKLFDSLAAGRPLVVTPRTETRRLVETHGVGVVAAGDRVEDLAAAIVELVADEARSQALGAAARRAAEAVFDWRIVGARISSEVLRREAAG
jgi:glycosyltransferase involved in cell wall biosynthesis